MKFTTQRTSLQILPWTPPPPKKSTPFHRDPKTSAPCFAKHADVNKHCWSWNSADMDLLLTPLKEVQVEDCHTRIIKELPHPHWFLLPLSNLSLPERHTLISKQQQVCGNLLQSMSKCISFHQDNIINLFGKQIQCSLRYVYGGARFIRISTTHGLWNVSVFLSIGNRKCLVFLLEVCGEKKPCWNYTRMTVGLLTRQGNSIKKDNRWTWSLLGPTEPKRDSPHVQSVAA